MTYLLQRLEQDLELDEKPEVQGEQGSRSIYMPDLDIYAENGSRVG